MVEAKLRKVAFWSVAFWSVVLGGALYVGQTGCAKKMGDGTGRKKTPPQSATTDTDTNTDTNTNTDTDTDTDTNTDTDTRNAAPSPDATDRKDSAQASRSAGRTAGGPGTPRSSTPPKPLIRPIAAKAPQRAVQKTAASLNAFTVSLWQALGWEAKNTFLSPWSVNVALAMAYAGAKGQTAREMARVCKYTLATQKLHAALGTLIQSLRGDHKRDGYDLVVANSIWPHVTFKLRPAFVETVRKNYGVGVRKLDYTGNRRRNAAIINRWVAHWTHGMIKKLLSPRNLGSDMRLTLVNTIYFKGLWAKQFRKSQTQSQPFHLLGGGRVQTPLMYRSLFCPYKRTAHWTAVRLPYKGKRMVMEVVLPKKRNGLKRVESAVAKSGFRIFSANPRVRQVLLYLPRFEMKRRLMLKPALQKMGLRTAFNLQKADFSGIAPPIDQGFFINGVIHKAVLEVDEQGTKAAAATAVAMPASAPPARPRPIPVFRADHPFLLLIRDRKTGVVLFVGRVLNPKA
jgi:serpin B